MNYADIKHCDVANGPGVRVSLFVSGCTHHCKECFNPETWDFAYGKPFTEETVKQILDYLAPEYIKGLTLLGGEPMEKSNQEGLLPLVRAVRQKYPDITIWCFTGYDFEKDILGYMMEEWETDQRLLSYFDVRSRVNFRSSIRIWDLPLRGHLTRRTIMVQESLQKGRLCIWQPQ